MPRKDDHEDWMRLGRAMSTYKRAKRQFRLARDEVLSIAKHLPVTITLDGLSATSSEDEGE